MATDTTHLPQGGELNADVSAEASGNELDFGAVQMAAATDAAGQPVQLAPGQQVVLIPVTPGQTITLPTDNANGLLAKIGPEGNLAIVVDGRTIIFQGYVQANDQSPVRVVTNDGDVIDVADLVAATDPNLDIQTAAGPATGNTGDAAGSGIFTPFIPGAGPGLIGAEGVLGATALNYKLIDDERREDVREEEDRGPTSITITFDNLEGVINEDDLPGEQRQAERVVVREFSNYSGQGNDEFDTKDREPGSQNTPPDDDDTDSNDVGVDEDREPLVSIATVTVDFGGDVPGKISLSDLNLPTGLTSEGQPIIYQVLDASGGQGNGIVGFVDGNGDGKFNEISDRIVFDVKVQEASSNSVFHVAFTLYDNIDNEAPDANKDGKYDLLGANEQILDLPVQVTATDSKGASISAVMTLGVEDDIPHFGQLEYNEGEGGIHLTIVDTQASIVNDESAEAPWNGEGVLIINSYAPQLTALGFGLDELAADDVASGRQEQLSVSFGADGASQEWFKDDSDPEARDSIHGILSGSGENEKPFEFFLVQPGTTGAPTEADLTVADQKTNAKALYNGVEYDVYVHQVNAQLIVGYINVEPSEIAPTGKLQAFILVVDNGGTMSFAQTLPISHPVDGSTPEAHDDSFTILGADGTQIIHVRATDYDGDHATQPLNLEVEDDGPSITLSLNAEVELRLDESVGVPAGDKPADGNANDENGHGGIGYASITGANLFTETEEFGNDRQAVTNARVFSLVINGDADSGLVDSETNQAIILVDKGNGVVEGHVGAADGALSFTVTVDVASGDVTVQQFRALEHGNPSDGDESSTPEIMDSDKLLLQVTVTDGDGDTASASVDLGSVIKFEDDAPIARDDVDSLQENDGAFSAAGNVITGDGVDTPGVDDGGSDKVAVISKLDGVTSDDEAGEGGFIVNGTYGKLTMDANGNYTYDFDEANWQGKVPSGSTEIFTYTYTDSDGDSDTATLTIKLGDASVSTYAAVNPGGDSLLKEDVETPIALTAQPGAGDRVTQIVLDNIPNGWNINEDGVTLSNGTVGNVSTVGGKLTIEVIGATAGVAVTATVPVTASEDSDVDGDNLEVSATVVDGVVFATASSQFDVTVDAVLDQYLDVSAGGVAPLTESASQQIVGLNLSSAFASTGFAHALAGGPDTDTSEVVNLSVTIHITGDTAQLQLAAAIPGVTLFEVVPGVWTLTADTVGHLQSAISTLQAIVPAGFDGTINGQISVTTQEANTPAGTVSGSGNEPDVTDNTYTDTTNFAINVTPDTTVTTSAVVGAQGASYLKEDAYGPVTLTATPGATDHVTQIVLSNVPAGWDVKDGPGAFFISGGTIVGTPDFDPVTGTITFNIGGAGNGAPVSITVQMKAAEDSDVDGVNLNVAATATDGDGGETANSSSNFNVTVDAVLDQFLVPGQTAQATATESGATQNVSLLLTSTLHGIQGNPFPLSTEGGADTDGSEILPTTATITVPDTVIDLAIGAGFPGNATLVETAPNSGIWTLTGATAADLQQALTYVQAVVPAGFDGQIFGQISLVTLEKNTPSAGSTEPASGSEPDQSDNRTEVTSNFSLVVRPDTTVNTSAVVGTQGAAFLKEDVYGPITLTATPGATDHVTQIVLANVPAGWDVKDDSLADFTIVGGSIVGTPVYDAIAHTITFNISGAADGAPVSVTVQVKANEDSDVDGIGLTVQATSADGPNSFANAPVPFNVTVDAVLDAYVDVQQSSAPTVGESGASQNVSLNLSSFIIGGVGAPFANSFAGGATLDNDGSEIRPVSVQIEVPNTAIDLLLAGGAPAGTTLTETAPNSGIWILTGTSSANMQAALSFVQATVPAGFDGTINGTVTAVTEEDNTNPTPNAASGNEPDQTDNRVTDVTNFTINVTPDTTVNTAAEVGSTAGAYLKEDAYGPVKLIATPGATDHVTQIVLSNVPAGWDVKDDSNADFVVTGGTLVGTPIYDAVTHTITFNISGAASGAQVTVTVLMKANEDSDVDGLNLNVAATAFDNDGVTNTSSNSNFNVTVDAVLDQYLDVGQVVAPVAAESNAVQNVSLQLFSTISGGLDNPFPYSIVGGSDTDGSEIRPTTATITVPNTAVDLVIGAGFPGSATLVETAPNSGVWTLTGATPSDLQQAIGYVQAVVPAGFDGTISGSISVTTEEDNTNPTPNAASGNEPDQTDNRVTDTANFTVNITPSTTVNTTAEVGQAGAAFLKEDVFGPVKLTATPGATDHVTQIVLSGVPAGWDVKDDSNADFTIVGGTIVGTPVYNAITHTITFDVTGTTDGVPVSITVQVKAAEDTDVDGVNLNVAATVVDGDGGESTSNNSNFNVTVDAILDQYLNVSAAPIADLTEGGSNQFVFLNLSSAFATTPFANALAGGADGDGSEKVQLTATITVTGDAVNLTMFGAIGGVSLVEGPAGTWTMTAPDLASLQLALPLVQAVVPAGFDGTVTGSISITTKEANTPQGTVLASGNEPDTTDNTYTDVTNFTFKVNPDTTVTTSAVVGIGGQAFLKEDVYGPVALTATPGATDHVTQIVLSNIPAGWDVKDDSIADFQIVGGTFALVPVYDAVAHTITFTIQNSAAGVPVTVTVLMKGGEDSDVDGLNLNVAATAVDNDGVTSVTNNSNFNVTVDAILDQYVHVTAGAVAAQTESGASQVVGLNLSSSILTAPFTNSLQGGADGDGSELRPMVAQISVPNTAIDLTLSGGFPAGTTLVESAPNSGVWNLSANSPADLQTALTHVQAIIPAGFDGFFSGLVTVNTLEKNTPPISTEPASGNEPFPADNVYSDVAQFIVEVKPSTTVETSAVVGTQGAAYLKEDVYAPIALTATPGATDIVTQILLSDLPAGWDVKDDSLADFQIVGGTIIGTPVYDAIAHVIVFNIAGAAVGVPVTVTVQVKANEDSDVDALNLNVAASVVDADGGENTANNSSFNVTVDAILDQYLNVTAGGVAALTESASNQVVGLNLSSAFATTAFANALAGGTDTDGSEKVILSVTITIAGDAANLQLSAVVPNTSLTEGAPGVWTLTSDSVAHLQDAISKLQAIVPAGFDGTITGQISVTTEEDNTNPNPNLASGNEPDQNDNRVTDNTNFSITVTPSTTVTPTAEVGQAGAAFLKEDVFGPVKLTAAPGATDHVTQIVLSNVPAGWDVKDDSLADFVITGGTIVGTPVYNAVTHTITFDISGAADGAPVSITVQVKASEDSDVDGTNLNVAATAVDNDGVTSTTNNSNFNVTVDAILDEYLNVTAGAIAAQTENAAEQVVGLNLSSAFASSGFANALQGGSDTDTSEAVNLSATITVTGDAADLKLAAAISGVSLTEGAPGTWTLTADTLAHLQQAISTLQAKVPAGFDGTITGQISLTSFEKNTPGGLVPASGNEPILSDNVKVDLTDFSITVTPSTTVTPSAEVGTAGAAYLKEDVFGPVKLTATPGATDHVTQIVLSGVPLGWDVKDDSNADFTIVGGSIVGSPIYNAGTGTITFNISGATDGTPVSITVQMKAGPDSDVDGANLNVAATVVDGDGGESTSNNSNFNVTVDAILDEYLNVTAGAIAAQTESSSNQVVGLNLSSAFSIAPFTNAFAGGSDTDGSEKVILSVTITITGDAANLQLASAVTNTTLTEGVAGTWTLTSDSVSHLQEAISKLQAIVPAGFDGVINGSIAVTTEEDNTNPTPNGASGNEPDQTDNRVTDNTAFSITVNPSTTVTPSAEVGTAGAAFLKEDVFGPVKLTATPGATDHVTQIVLSGVPAGWDVKDDSNADFTVVGGTIVGTPTYNSVTGTITFNLTGTTDGVAVSITVQMKAAPDSDVDGLNLNVAATVVDNDGGESTSNNSNFNVTVDAILDQFVDVSQTAQATATESGSSQSVFLNLTSAIVGAGGNPFTNSMAGGADTDNSEIQPTTATITVPNTAIDLVLSGAPGGTTLVETAANSGIWTLTVSAASNLQSALAAVQAVIPAGFDGTVTGQVSVTTKEANTPQGTVVGSGLEPDTSDNSKTDLTDFSVKVNPDTTVTTSAIVGTGGVGYLKEDVQGPIALVANPGDTDTVTQIVLSNVPAGWTLGAITLSSGSVGSSSFVGNVLTINVNGAAVGVTITATVQVTAAADSDVDGTGLTVKATVVDGASSFTNAPVAFNVPVDAVLDQFVDVNNASKSVNEAAGTQNVLLDLTSALTGASGNPFTNSFAGGAGADGDNSEKATVQITVNGTANTAGVDLVLIGAPAGAALSETSPGSGIWNLTANNVADVQTALTKVAAALPAGYDGTISGTVTATTSEANTPQGTVPASGNEPDVSDNTKVDVANYSLTVNQVNVPDANPDTNAVAQGSNVNYQLMLVIDISGSMGDTVIRPDGTSTTRMELQKAAVIALLESYVASTSGNVNVKIVTFSNGANYIAGTAAATFVNVSNGANMASVETAINALAPTNYTDYDDALFTARQGINDASWLTTSATTKGLVYFFSDGAPTESDGSSPFGGSGSTDNSLNQYEEDQWEGRSTATGLADKGVISIAVGLGADVANSSSALSALGQVAYYNETFPDNSVIVVNDENQLVNEIIQTIPSSVTGNLLTNDSGGPDGYGAPKVFSASLIDDADSDLVSTVTNATTITITTNNGVLVIDRATGDYTYTAKPGTGGKVDSFNYTIQDATGDQDASTLTITISAPISVTGTAVVNGNNTAQFFVGDDANNTVNASGGNDSIQGGYGNDILNGDDGDDGILGQEGNDTINGGNGNDALSGGNGDDTIDGGADNDVIDGGTGNDNLLGGTGNDILEGAIGNDTLQGGAGNDTLDGGTGNDNLQGGANDDTYFFLLGDGTDTIVDTSGTDKIVINGGASGVNTFQATRSGNDLVLQYGNSSLTDTITVTGHFTGTGNIETLEIIGGAFAGTYTVSNDTTSPLDGGAGNDVIAGGTADETLNGAGGIDLLSGGLGNDTLDGGSGADRLLGGDGNDTYTVDNAGDVVFDSAGTNDVVNSSVTFNLLNTGVEHLNLTGGGNINGTGTDSVNNIINGNTGTNTLNGGSGDDTLFGGADSVTDTLNGGDGNDTLIWRDANDVYNGDAGTDTLSVGQFASVNFTTVDDSVINNVERISMSGGTGTTITLNATDVISDFETSNFNPSGGTGGGNNYDNRPMITIDGDSNDTVNLAGGNWFATPGSGGFDSNYTLYAHVTSGTNPGNNEDAYVLIQNGVNVTGL
jgi:VCBS repeat-containing protein